MIRASTKLPNLLPKTSVSRRGIKVSNVLKASNTSTSPKKGSVIKKLFALTLFSGGGVVGYSWYDQEFRKMLQDNVPYAKEVLDTIFEYLPSKEDVSKMFVPKEETNVKPFAKKLEETAQPKAVKVAVMNEKTKEEREKDKKREVERLLREKKENDTTRISDLEGIIQRKAVELRGRVGAVLEAGKSATEVTRLHSKKLKEALKASDSKDGDWEGVTTSQEHRVHATSVYDKLEAKTREELKGLWDEVSRLRNDKSMRGNKMVSSVSAEVEKMTRELNTTIKQLTQAQSEVKVFSEYKDLVKKGRERFQKELESVMPTIKTIPASFSKMTEDELNALIGHAHKRIDQLQNRLAEQETLEEVRITEAVERQKDENRAFNMMSINMEKQTWEREFEMMKAKWDIDARMSFEEELKHQIIRQAAAHNEHINDVLRVQQRELEAKFSLLLSEHVQTERRVFQKEVAASVARMQGIEEAIEKRAQFEKQSHQIQRLWLACEALQTAIGSGNVGATTWQGRLKPLGPEVDLIKQSFPGQTAVRSILDSMPEVALNRGVWTEGGLIERFKRVDKVCRQVAMVDETAGVDGSIFRYFLSSFQSKLVVPGVSKIYQNPDEEIDPQELNNVFFLLDNAQACLDRGDLTQAVRFVNQLTGEPRRAIGDWLDEARLLLETKQLSTALLASASAAGFSSVAATT